MKKIILTLVAAFALPCGVYASDVPALIAKRDQLKNEIETQGKIFFVTMENELKSFEMTPECQTEEQKFHAEEKLSPKCLAELKKQLLGVKAFEEKNKSTTEKMQTTQKELQSVRIQLVEALEKQAPAAPAAK